MEISFTSLGTASALPTISRFSSAHVLKMRGRLFLIDCGEGCQMQLRKYRFSMVKIESIFISHLHGDHCFGLFGLLSTMAMLGRSNRLRIFAPAEFSEILDFFMKHFGEGVKYEIEHIVLNAKEPTKIFEARTFEIFAFPLNHRVETFGFLFKEKLPLLNVFRDKVVDFNLTAHEISTLKKGIEVIRGDGTTLSPAEFTYRPYIPRSFAYCSDTAPFSALKDWISGVDLLYHEATYGKDMEKLAETTTHSTASQTALCAREAGVGKLLIGHFSSRYPNISLLLDEARGIFPNTEISKEGEANIIELKKFKKE